MTEWSLRRLSLLGIVLVISLLALAACTSLTPEEAGATPSAETPAQPLATVRPTARPGPTNTRGETATGTPGTSESAAATLSVVPVYMPDPSELSSAVRDGWQIYENARYGFVLRYPGGWSLTEVTGAGDTMAGHRVDLVMMPIRATGCIWPAGGPTRQCRLCQPA
ncbi:MAG: hypothetical protein ACYCYF_00920 [Anaerolineae bacterium]